MQELVACFDLFIRAFQCNMTPFQTTPAQSEPNNKSIPSGYASIFEFFAIKERIMPPLRTKKEPQFISIRTIELIIIILAITFKIVIALIAIRLFFLS